MEQTIVSNQEQTKLVNEEARIKRECKGRALAISRSVFTLQNSNNHGFYVESESAIDRYYYIEYKQNAGMDFCTCWDFASHRADKCKHIFAVEYALRLNLLQEVDKRLPISQKPVIVKAKSWEDDSYDF